jgi:UDP-N-acetylmuramate: L-alanyl-gamma-D-glutamyl-meso-diaminopimelate ligase
MKIHFIAIGGSIMHQLALQLLAQGHEVTGSDDAIYDPALSNLKAKGICPTEYGWFPEKITKDLEMVVLGKHAHADNAELAEARALEIKVVTFPELIYTYSQDKTRIVVGGSHGKTTTTSIIVHTLLQNDMESDFMVGAKIEGVKGAVRLTESAPYMVIEGDEYPTSAEDPRPKLVHYHPNIAILTGVAWDHMNVFPTYEIYRKVFADYIASLSKDAHLVYFEGDAELPSLVEEFASCNTYPYKALNAKIESENYYLLDEEGKQYPCSLYGEHNLQNLAAAKKVWEILDKDSRAFYEAASKFGGAAKRLQYLADREGYTVIKDYAHSPSKVKAAVAAVREKYASRKLVVVCELHTYSSLNIDFMIQRR